VLIEREVEIGAPSAAVVMLARRGPGGRTIARENCIPACYGKLTFLNTARSNVMTAAHRRILDRRARRDVSINTSERCASGCAFALSPSFAIATAAKPPHAPSASSPARNASLFAGAAFSRADALSTPAIHELLSCCQLADALFMTAKHCLACAAASSPSC